RAKLVNYSWGLCEDQLSAAHQADMDKVFARAIAQGVNIFAASGDSGSDCEGTGTNVSDFPADSPNITAVGGTTLTVKGTSRNEAGWSGSGGGISKKYAKPDYEASFDASVYTGRAYPDISFNADPSTGQAVWAHYSPFEDAKTASYVVVGGTSMAAP